LNNSQKSKLFLILSLHRSGSSAIAGVLHQLGVHMGNKLLDADYSNPKGHFENVDFLNLNEKILNCVEAKWSEPPSRESIVSSNFPKSEILSFILEQEQVIWGLKDPRITLTFDIWRPHLEEFSDITYVFVWRPIEESIRSLSHRNKIDLTTARTILEPYLINLRCYREELEKDNKDILDINFKDILDEPENFTKQINLRINQKQDHHLNLVKKFLDQKLKHF